MEVAKLLFIMVYISMKLKKCVISTQKIVVYGTETQRSDHLGPFDFMN